MTNPLTQKLGYKKIIKENFPCSTSSWEAVLQGLRNESKLLLGWQGQSPGRPLPAAPAPEDGPPPGVAGPAPQDSPPPPPQEQAGGWISSLQKAKDILVTDVKRTVGCLLANVSLLHRAHFARWGN